ncbi:MAG: hypothetical protein MK105_12640 [Crocinitomicaceae bacterium]|nr:hypothetical protein [Crocinitomicaceae bacterium]
MRNIFFEKLIFLKQLFITLNENFGPKPHCCVAPTVIHHEGHAMVDVKKRNRLAELLRHLSTGQISNDEFEDKLTDEITEGYLPEQFYRAKGINEMDPVLRPIVETAWGLYDDTRNHKLTESDELTGYAKKEIARFILFLKSDQEYTWDYIDLMNPIMRFSFKDMLKSIATLGQHYRNLKLSRDEEFARIKETGDFAFWPFKTKEDFENELKNQPYLAGQK